MVVPSFSFSRTPRLLFGQGTLSQVAPLATQYKGRVLLVTGAHSFTSTPYWAHLLESLTRNRLEWEQVIISGEPTPCQVDEAVEEYRYQEIKVVIAIGGGSVLDAGKAISAMLPTREGSVQDYLEGVGDRRHDGVKVPFIALPTTAGTGSEATHNAVLRRMGPGGFKKSLRHEALVPEVAIIDLLLAICCPPEITRASGMDAMTQLIESYVSTGSSPITDSLAWTGLKNVKASLLKAFHEPSEPDSREKMALAAFLSGITLTNAGLGLVHGLSSAIASQLDIPHGVICGALLGGVTEATITTLLQEEKEAAVKKYAALGALFQGTRGDLLEDAFLLVESIQYYRESLSLPLLSTYGFGRNHVEELLQGDHHKFNPASLSKNRIQDLLLEQI